MNSFLKHLLIQTIYSPANAARMIASMKLSSQIGWMLLMLAAIFNTFVYFANMALVTVPPEFAALIPDKPLVYLALSFSFTTVMVFCLHWLGRVQGGTASLSLLIVLLAWLLAVQALADVVFLVLLVFVPMLAGLFSMAAGLYGIWILLNFVQIAHGFHSKGKAVATIFLSLLGVMMGLVLILSMIGGVTAVGIN